MENKVESKIFLPPEKEGGDQQEGQIWPREFPDHREGSWDGLSAPLSQSKTIFIFLETTRILVLLLKSNMHNFVEYIFLKREKNN